MAGKFITFEGGEGSGKSTQIKLMEAYLRRQGVETLLTKEPGGTDIGLALRKILVEGDADKLDAKAEALLFFADRRIHMVQKVWPAMEKNQWVLSDRFADSTMAYQYYAYEKRLLKTDIQTLYQFSVGDFKPDLTLILDIDPEIGLARSYKKAVETNTCELRNEMRHLSWHQRLREGYLQIAKEEPERCVVLNADTSVEDLHSQIKQVIQERFGV